jgi:hypothetical protein
MLIAHDATTKHNRAQRVVCARLLDRCPGCEDGAAICYGVVIAAAHFAGT